MQRDVSFTILFFMKLNSQDHGGLTFLKIVTGLTRGPIKKVPHCDGLHFICLFYPVSRVSSF